MRQLQPDDIAAAVLYAVSQPSHVCVSEVLVRPTDQEL
jgi:NADP-dependent 3-hydroxy acid dehydrogenase YdfG